MAKKAAKKCARCGVFYIKNGFRTKHIPDEVVTRVVFQTENKEVDRVFTMCDGCLHKFMAFVSDESAKKGE